MSNRRCWSVATCERIIGHAYRINMRHGYWRCIHCGAILPGRSATHE